MTREPVYEVGSSDPIAEIEGPCDTHPITDWGFGASGIEQESPANATFCPDCSTWIEAARFVQHRAEMHPPAPRELQVSGIASQEQVGMPGGGR